MKLKIQNSFLNVFTCSCFSKDVRLPHQLQRAMAAEAEAARDSRAKVSVCKVLF